MNRTMKAVVYQQYGAPEVLHQAEINRPVPRKKEVLIKVHATTVTIGDTIMRSLSMPVKGLEKIMARVYLGWSKPRRPILGMELAGVIEAVGENVTRFSPGQAVMASTFGANFGGYAEYKCMPEDEVMALKPKNLTYHEAAAVVGAGLTALSCLTKGNIQSGQNVLIYGASGAVGTNAVQLASHYFGANVTGVCSTGNMELVSGLGAKKVLDYTQSDFNLDAAAYDVVFDAVGKLNPAMAKQALKPEGVYLNVLADSGGGNSLEYLQLLKKIIEAGKLKPVIDRVYTFDQIVEAHHYVEKGHKKGNVVIEITENN